MNVEVAVSSKETVVLFAVGWSMVLTKMVARRMLRLVVVVRLLLRMVETMLKAMVLGMMRAEQHVRLLRLLLSLLLWGAGRR